MTCSVEHFCRPTNLIDFQVLKGTHRCGRIDHNMIHGQTVADQERIDQLSKHFEHVYAELNPGGYKRI